MNIIKTLIRKYYQNSYSCRSPALLFENIIKSYIFEYHENLNIINIIKMIISRAGLLGPKAINYSNFHAIVVKCI